MLQPLVKSMTYIHIVHCRRIKVVEINSTGAEIGVEMSGRAGLAWRSQGPAAQRAGSAAPVEWRRRAEAQRGGFLGKAGWCCPGHFLRPPAVPQDRNSAQTGSQAEKHW